MAFQAESGESVGHEVTFVEWSTDYGGVERLLDGEIVPLGSQDEGVGTAPHLQDN